MLPQRIKELRLEKKLSQTRLAALCRVSQQAVAKWETGLCIPEPEKLLMLCDIFSVCADYLLGLTRNRSISLSLLNDDEAFACLSLFHSKPELKTLVEEAKTASKEELLRAVQVLKALLMR